MVGLARLELATPRLSSVCSNQLSYKPLPGHTKRNFKKKDKWTALRPADQTLIDQLDFLCFFRNSEFCRAELAGIFLRKEVIQPQVPLRLPCYDFTPVTSPTVAVCPLAVSETS